MSLEDLMPDYIFHGSDYDKKRDGTRLATQLDRIINLVHGVKWWSLSEIAQATGYGEASISAQLRNSKRKGYILEKEHIQNGLFKYRLKVQSMYEVKK